MSIDEKSEKGALVGEVLDGKYSIVSLLGQGGMGAVYQAKHIGTKRVVALKVIVPRMTNNTEFVERFRREAEAAGGLRHPNVVDVTDFGFARVGDDEIAYLVMEYLDGCSLADVLAEEGTLSLEWVVDILEQTCSAVEEAHRRGIIHRDLKPHNIWLEPNRRGGYTVKVLDFGLAKIHETGLEPAESALTQRLAPPVDVQGTRPLQSGSTLDGPRAVDTAAWNADSVPAAAFELTQVGTAIGTPYYMSPEQCRGRPVDERSDVYSLGIIAYEMLSGRRPFTGPPVDVLAKQVLDPPEPLAEVSPNVPKGVADAVMSALEKDPAKRPERATRFASTVRANAEGVGRLLRKAVAVCSEHLPVFLQLFAVAYAPLVLIRLVKLGVRLAGDPLPEGLIIAWNYGFGLIGASIATFFASAIARGVSALLLAQLAAAPLRALRINLAFGVLRQQLRPLLLGALFYLGLATLPLMIFFLAFDEFANGMAMISNEVATVEVLVWTVGSLVVALVSGYIMLRNFVTYSLFPIVLLIETSGVIAALKRSRALVGRDRDAVVPVAVVESMQWAVPMAVSFVAAALFSIWQVGLIVVVAVATVTELLLSPVVSVAYGMLYLKLRQAGGESVDDVFDDQYVKQDLKRTSWMQRMERRPPSTTGR